MRKILTITTFILSLLYAGICYSRRTYQYIDSVNKYSAQVDSLVEGFYNIPPTKLSRIIAHYTCVTGSGGAYVEVYGDSANTKTYQIDYWFNCEIGKHRIYYLINNKIVLIITDAIAQTKRAKKYFRDDVLIAMNEELANKTVDKDLKMGT